MVNAPEWKFQQQRVCKHFPSGQKLLSKCSTYQARPPKSAVLMTHHHRAPTRDGTSPGRKWRHTRFAKSAELLRSHFSEVNHILSVGLNSISGVMPAYMQTKSCCSTVYQTPEKSHCCMLIQLLGFNIASLLCFFGGVGWRVSVGGISWPEPHWEKRRSLLTSHFHVGCSHSYRKMVLIY